MSFRSLRLISLLLALLSTSLAAAPKTDVILMKNGDRITGEIKSLLRGKLELSTDHMGTIQIEWEHIDEVVSKTGQAIELANGTRFYGTLEKPESEDFVRIGTEEGAVGVSSEDIVAMYPVETSFWNRLDLSAQLGFSWDKSSEVGKYNLQLDATWRDPRFVTRAAFVADVTTQKGREDTARSVLNLNHMRFLPKKRFRGVFGNLENNDELGLDLRALAGAGYGWIPIRSQRSLFGLMAGLAVNREIPREGDSETNLEAVGSLVYDYFRYSEPDREFRVDLSVYPSLTQTGRWRAAFNMSYRLDLIGDLFWGLSAYAVYDSEPATEDASKSDYGVSSTIGYNF